jgi:hypothetical protein
VLELTFLTVALLASTLTLPPLKPVKVIDLSAQGDRPGDVAWLNDDEVLVTLIRGGVVRVSAKTGKSSVWLPIGPMPDGAPFPEYIATDGKLVVIVAGGSPSAMFRSAQGKYLFGYTGSPLYFRGLAVSGGKAFFMGWMTRSGTTADQQRGALFVQTAPDTLGETPIHRVVSSKESLARWRLTMSQYAGAAVALPDGSIAIVTSAEPGVFRYDRKGKLKEVLGSSVDSLIVDSKRLVQTGGQDIVARYKDDLNLQPAIDDLVATPGGLAILVRVASNAAANDEIEWELWTVGAGDITRRQALAKKRNGPFGHMKCEARGTRMACITAMPSVEEAGDIKTAGANPTLMIFKFSR